MSVSRIRRAFPFTLNVRSPASFSIQKSSPMAKSFSCIRYLVAPSASRRPRNRGIFRSFRVLERRYAAWDRRARSLAIALRLVDDDGLHNLIREGLPLVIP